MDSDQSPQEAAAASAQPKARLLSMRGMLIWAAVAILCLVLLAYFLKQSADITGPVEMGIHGWIAMGLGVILSLAVGMGLMALVFFSARHGYDERAQTRDEE